MGRVFEINTISKEQLMAKMKEESRNGAGRIFIVTDGGYKPGMPSFRKMTIWERFAIWIKRNFRKEVV